MTLTLCVQAGMNGRKPEPCAKKRVSALNAQIWKMIHTVGDKPCDVQMRLLQLLLLSQQSIVFTEIAILDVLHFYD